MLRAFYSFEKSLRSAPPVITLIATLSTILATLIFLPRRLHVSANERSHQQELFRQIFGEKLLHFDPNAIAKLKTLPPGQRVLLDTDGDGRLDTAYFIDTDPKHRANFRPIVVKAIDQDGDMDRDRDADLDSDLYIADWRGNGDVDAVVEYRDLDHDNALDEMAIYTYSANNKNLGTDAIQVWWSRDIGHDHQLWDTINYRYQQPEVQFRTHFGGDEIFSNYVYDSRHSKWVPGWENPFAFYDEDHDDLSEVTIRFSGRGNRMLSMRYGFDADNDTTAGNPHDYDFSFTGLASPDGGDTNAIPVPESLMERPALRGGPAEPILSWKHARSFGEHAPWKRVLLTWVENDNDIDGSPTGDPHPRWEGVINSASEWFPQIGGPPIGPYNARYEVDLTNRGRLQLYYSATDHKIHLKGADHSWLKVDYNFDGKVDAEYRYRDTDGDGMTDTWDVDVDGDGTIDHSFTAPHPRIQMVPLQYTQLTHDYNQWLSDALEQNHVLIAAMKATLQRQHPDFHDDPAEQYFATKLGQYRARDGVGARIRDSRGATRYYQDLIRERYYVQIRNLLIGQPELMQSFDRAYDQGDYRAAARILLSDSVEDGLETGFSRSAAVTVTNPDASWRLHEPIVVPISSIRRVLSDFNTENFMITQDPRWIATREIPSQADDTDLDGNKDELVWEADLQPQSITRFWINEAPRGSRKSDYPHSTFGGIGWTGESRGITWESDRIAYRMAHGQIDFFAKKVADLVQARWRPDEFQKAESERGMFVLAPGATGGLGGLGAAAKRNQFRLIATGPVRTIVEAKSADLTQRYTIYAHQPYFDVESISTENRTVAPEFVKMPADRMFFDAKAGVFGVWGRQNAIVQEIGMAAVFQPGAAALRESDLERDLLFHVTKNKSLHYQIVGDWRRGRMFPVSPGIVNWEEETRSLVQRFHHPVTVNVGVR